MLDEDARRGRALVSVNVERPLWSNANGLLSRIHNALENSAGLTAMFWGTKITF